MFRLDPIIEHWATIYKPISHSADKKKKHKAFYRVRALEENNEFVRNFNTACSPAVAYSNLIDGRLRGKDIRHSDYSHTIYFLVKQKEVGRATIKNEDDEAAECLYQLNGLVEEFLAWLMEERRIQIDPQHTTDRFVRECWRGLDVEGAEWASAPMKWNGWWVMGLEISQLQPRPLCSTVADYSEDPHQRAPQATFGDPVTDDAPADDNE